MSFRKGPSSQTLTDAYHTFGLHLYYDTQDSLEFIETFPPCNPRFEGQSFSSLPIGTVITARRAHGYQVDEDGMGGYTFAELGIALYVSDKNIEGVAIYRRGYYESVGDKQ